MRLYSIGALARVRHVIGRLHKAVKPSARLGGTVTFTPVSDAIDTLGDMDPRIARIINDIPRRRRRHV